MGREKELLDRNNETTLGSSKKFDLLQDEIFMKYANKSLPLQNKKKTRAGLSPYTGAFTKKHALHLLKRTMFGAKASDLNTISNLTASQAVDMLLSNANLVTPAPPVNYYQNIYNDPQSIAYGATWDGQSYTDGTTDYYRKQSVRAWWMNNILTQNISIQEKMILFLSNFYPIELNSGLSQLNYDYLTLLRTYSMGNLKDFVRDLTINPAILRYLNGQYNTKYAPDENYARELQELFTIGKLGQVYTEYDVIAAAKVLTGWRVNLTTNQSYYDESRHDTTNKVFSLFYGFNTIQYTPGPNGGMTALNDLIDMIFLKQQEVAKHFCRNLYRFFVYYDITSSVESTIINGLATTLINNNWEIKPVLEILLKSDHFFDNAMMDCLIKTPMDYYLGTLRTIDFQVPSTYSVEDWHRLHINLSDNFCNPAGMRPGDPPNVSGWQAYYQVPFYHQSWINSDTLPKRVKNMDNWTGTYGMWVRSGLNQPFDWLSFVKNNISNPGDPDIVVQECVDLLLGVGLSQTSRDHYKSHLLSGQTSNFYWTVAWNDYINFPSNSTYQGVVATRLRNMFKDMMRLAETHLS